MRNQQLGVRGLRRRAVRDERRRSRGSHGGANRRAGCQHCASIRLSHNNSRDRSTLDDDWTDGWTPLCRTKPIIHEQSAALVQSTWSARPERPYSRGGLSASTAAGKCELP